MELAQESPHLSDKNAPRRLRRTTRFQPTSLSSEEKGEAVQATPHTAVPPLCPKGLAVTTFLYALFLIVLTAVDLLGSDRWWWIAPNQYLPQSVWGIVPCCLLLIFIKRYRRGVWAAILMILWVGFPIMDFRFALARPNVGDRKGTHLRLLTYNVKNGYYGHERMTRTIQEANADIILLQQAHGTYKNELVSYLSKYHLYIVDQYILASKFPILEANTRDLNVPQSRLVAQRCRLAVGKRVVTVYSVHLLSPRRGITGMRKNSEALYWNNRIRQIQGYRLGEYMKQEWGPVVLAGDLNAPVQSSITEALTDANLYNAFNLVGHGYGYTYGHTLPLRHSFTRIDHIYLSRDFVTLDCFTGSAKGSDHRPLIADLFLPAEE